MGGCWLWVVPCMQRLGWPSPTAEDQSNSRGSRSKKYALAGYVCASNSGQRKNARAQVESAGGGERRRWAVVSAAACRPTSSSRQCSAAWQRQTEVQRRASAWTASMQRPRGGGGGLGVRVGFARQPST